MRLLLLSTAVLLGTVSCTRFVKLPKSAASKPVVATVTRSTNAAMAAFDYATSGVRVQRAPTTDFTITGTPVTAQRVNLTQTRSFDVLRLGQPVASPSCTLNQVGNYVAFGGVVDDKTTRSMACADVDFELSLTQTRARAYSGTFTRGGRTYTVQSTVEMGEGPVSNLIANGFHVYEGKTWLGTVEYFFDGKLYLAPELAEGPREAAVLVALTIATTDGFLSNAPDRNRTDWVMAGLGR